MGEASFDVQVNCMNRHEPPPRSTSREMKRSKNPPSRPASRPRSAKLISDYFIVPGLWLGEIFLRSCHCHFFLTATTNAWSFPLQLFFSARDCGIWYFHPSSALSLLQRSVPTFCHLLAAEERQQGNEQRKEGRACINGWETE